MKPSQTIEKFHVPVGNVLEKITTRTAEEYPIVEYFLYHEDEVNKKLYLGNDDSFAVFVGKLRAVPE